MSMADHTCDVCGEPLEPTEADRQCTACGCACCLGCSDGGVCLVCANDEDDDDDSQ